MAKVTVSFEWLSGCSGCELTIVDLHERLLTVLEEIDIVRLPILMDVKDYPKAALGIVTGALRTITTWNAPRRCAPVATPSWPSAPAHLREPPAGPWPEHRGQTPSATRVRASVRPKACDNACGIGTKVLLGKPTVGIAP